MDSLAKCEMKHNIEKNDTFPFYIHGDQHTFSLKAVRLYLE